MKFLLIKNPKKDSAFKPIFSVFALFTFFYLIFDIIVKQNSIGITPLEIQTNFFGNEEEFIDPMQVSVFLEFWHMEIFFIMMILITINALYIRLSNNMKKDLFIIKTVSLSALFSLIFIILSYFFLPHLIYLYLFSFWLWHLGALYISLVSLKRLLIA